MSRCDFRYTYAAGEKVNDTHLMAREQRSLHRISSKSDAQAIQLLLVAISFLSYISNSRLAFGTHDSEEDTLRDLTEEVRFIYRTSSCLLWK